MNGSIPKAGNGRPDVSVGDHVADPAAAVQVLSGLCDGGGARSPLVLVRPFAADLGQNSRGHYAHSGTLLEKQGLASSIVVGNPHSEDRGGNSAECNSLGIRGTRYSDREGRFVALEPWHVPFYRKWQICRMHRRHGLLVYWPARQGVLRQRL